MARAAAKRRQPDKPAAAPARQRKQKAPKRPEDTLFFNRLRGQAKWMFVVLALVFGVGFVAFGVGSDIGGGLSDLFRDGGTGSGAPSIEKALRKTQDDPKNPAGWRELGEAYRLEGDTEKAIQAWVTFTELRPKQSEGYTQLASLYQDQVNEATQDAQLAAYQAQAAAGTDFVPVATSPLGRALAESPNKIAQAVSAEANERYNRALQERATALGQLVDTYEKLAALEPDDPILQLQVAEAAQQAGDVQTALRAYRKYLTLVESDDPQVPVIKQRIKELEAQTG